MDASKLTPEQAQKLVNAVALMVGYMHRLTHSMQRIGWDARDPMYEAAWDAYNAVHALRVHCHYASCMPGSADKPEQPPRGAVGGLPVRSHAMIRSMNSYRHLGLRRRRPQG